MYGCVRGEGLAIGYKWTLGVSSVIAFKLHCPGHEVSEQLEILRSALADLHPVKSETYWIVA